MKRLNESMIKIVKSIWFRRERNNIYIIVWEMHVKGRVGRELFGYETWEEAVRGDIKDSVNL